MRILLLLLISFFLSACDSEIGPSPKKTPDPSRKAALPAPARPPATPVVESFEGAPQLSLFARLGDYRPEDDDSVALPFWRTYVEHLVKISGVAVVDDGGNRAFALRGIKGLDSVGFFSPLAISPDTAYEVSFRARTRLPEGGTAGVGVLEYDRFLWISEQYAETLDRQHRRGMHAGVVLSGGNDWERHAFRFTTGADTGMIHLILFREGAAGRDPVFFDDIRIEPVRAD